jgi:hypothetical protein
MIGNAGSGGQPRPPTGRIVLEAVSVEAGERVRRADDEDDVGARIRTDFHGGGSS